MGTSVLEKPSRSASGFQASNSEHSHSLTITEAHQGQEKSFNERTLIEEIEYLNNNWQKEGLPSNWVDLPHIGFMIGYQMGFLDSPKWQNTSLQEKKNLWTRLTECSLRSWVGEYLAQQSVLPGLLNLTYEENRWKLKDALHGAGFELEETFSKRERGGVPYDTYINTIKPFFVNSPDGSVAVINSPSGEGIPDESGIPIMYPDSRLTIMQKQGKDIYMYTVANDFDYGEHAELMNRLHRYAGQEKAQLTQGSTAEEFISHPVLFKASEMSFQSKDIIHVMRQVRADLSSKTSKNPLYIYKNSTFEQTVSDVTDWYNLWDYDEITSKYIDQFGEFSRGDWKGKKKLQEALAITIMRLSRYVLQKEQEKFQIAMYKHLQYRYDYSEYSYGDVFTAVQSIPGCAGGGSTFSSSFKDSYLTVVEEGKLECVTCKFCGEVVDATVNGNTVTCPKCKESGKIYKSYN